MLVYNYMTKVLSERNIKNSGLPKFAPLAHAFRSDQLFLVREFLPVVSAEGPPYSSIKNVDPLLWITGQANEPLATLDPDAKKYYDFHCCQGDPPSMLVECGLFLIFEVATR